MASHTRADDHRFLEVIVSGSFFVDVFEFVFSDADHIAIFQRVFFYQLSIHERSVGTV